MPRVRRLGLGDGSRLGDSDGEGLGDSVTTMLTVGLGVGVSVGASATSVGEAVGSATATRGPKIDGTAANMVNPMTAKMSSATAASR